LRHEDGRGAGFDALRPSGRTGFEAARRQLRESGRLALLGAMEVAAAVCRSRKVCLYGPFNRKSRGRKSCGRRCSRR